LKDRTLRINGKSSNGFIAERWNFAEVQDPGIAASVPFPFPAGEPEKVRMWNGEQLFAAMSILLIALLLVLKSDRGRRRAGGGA